MSVAKRVRDEDDIRCVSPQRLVEASSASRVLPFPSSVTMSFEDRFRALREVDPEGADMIEHVTNRLYALRVHAAK